MRFATIFAFFAILVTSLAMTTHSVEAADKEVTFDVNGKVIKFSIDGEQFATFNYSKDWKKPFIFPLNAPGNVNVLRKIVPTKAEQGSSKQGTDHFHHKGVWVAVDSVNDEKLNFWHEGEKIVNVTNTVVPGENGTALLKVTNHWFEGETPLMKEHTTVTFHPSRLITYEISLTAIDKPVTFHDTKEGFFAVRVAHTMRQMEGGRIVNSEGDKGEKECWGKPTPWVDYTGEVDGKTVGVTLMDHPDNFRKSRYHVRGYGLFSISPFGPKKYSNGKEEASPVTLKPDGKPLSLKYGLFVHAGDEKEAKVAEMYKTFTGAK